MNIDINNVEVLDIDEFKKKNSQKNNQAGNVKIVLLLTVLIIILLFGVGLFFFLRYAKETTKATDLKNITVELGNEINEDIIDFKSKNKKCKKDISEVDTSKIGTYKYYVTCNKRRYSANIEVKDTTAPQVELKIANIKINSNLEPQQFVMSAYDLSEIEYSFDEDFKLDEYNNNNGLYIVPFKVSDEYKNINNTSGILLVSNIVASKYLSASKIMPANYNATLEVIDKIGFNQANYYINAIRIYNYTFNDKEEYNKVKEEYNNKGSINNIEGKTIYNEEKLNIKLVKTITKEELDKLNGEFPYSYNDIQKLYSSLNYKNKLETN